MEKYVAFLDILGFKNKMSTINQCEAEELIRDFSASIYHIWRSDEYCTINGYVVSDSLIVYSKDTSQNSLREIIDVIKKICQEEFSLNSILIRGAIAKGDFKNMPAAELPNLSKGLIVGNAYIEAYTLESSVKTLGIVLTNEVYEDYLNVFGEQKDVVKENEKIVLRYLDIDYILENNNLLNFVNLAIESNWLPHYYNTIYFALKNSGNAKKVDQVFINIISIISRKQEWRYLDTFIKNAFKDEVEVNFQTMFLRFIRQSLRSGDNDEIVASNLGL